jgi:electron transfer flavoprotein alpha subunit
MQAKLILIAETIENRLMPSWKELLWAAESLSPGSSNRIHLFIPGKDVKSLAERIATETGINVTAVEHDDLLFPNPPFLAKGLAKILQQNDMEFLCLIHNMRNCQIASSLSIDLNAACLTGIESIKIINDRPVFKRSLFNGKFEAEMTADKKQAILTIMPGAFSESSGKINNQKPGDCNVIKLKEQYSAFSPETITETAESDNSLEEADVILSAGMGIREEKNLDLLRDTSSIFSNAAIAGSRIVCDQGWLPYSRQVGETGKHVSPKLYMACGISGAYQHISGMKKSRWIVAVNTDPMAPIFKIADYGIVEDLTTFLPLLVSKYHELYGGKK